MTHSWRCAVAVPLTLLGLVALCQANSTPDYKCFKIFSPGIGTIEPRGDIVVEVGSSYEAYCLFNPAKVQVDDVYFKTTGRDRIIPHKVVNDSTISVQVTHNESTNYLLNCWAGNELICQRNVFVGYQPQDVENFTCLSRNWESLNCTWHVPENPVKVTYTLTYVIQDYLSEPRDCPLKEEGKNWCHWSGTHFHSGRQNWTMIITAKNELIEEPVEFRHHVDLYASVIPNMASNFTVDILGPRKAILTWQFPHPIDVFVEGKVTQEVKYRIKPFRNIVRNNPWILVDIWKETPLRFRRKTFNKTIGGLQPYVQYEFSVRLHTGTGPIRENMWSKPALLIRMTQNAQPTVAPLTTLGMFEVEETKLHRDVFVSWQTVDPLEENGPNFTYEVNMFDANDENLVFPSLTTEHCYAKFSRLENNITYRFEIRPRNRRGLPEDPNLKSEVIVPKKAALISIPDYFKVIAYLGNDTTTYMTRWRIPERYRASNNIKSVTLFWCKQTDYENRCQNKLSWEIIDDPFINVKNLTGYDTSSRYIFGISINSHDSSSGIEWSGCIASHGVQQPALEKFNYTYVSSTEVSLKWDLDCKAQAAQPIAFNISYCIVGENGKNCSEPEKYIKVDGESTVQYTVRNLRPYRHYIFNIATISELLGLGKWSRTVHVKTKPSKPSGPPHGIFEISKGQTWISLAWRPPLESEQNGRIIMYDIQFKVKGSQRGSNLEKNVLGHNFTGLEPFTEYHFEVVPCTEVHEGYACGTHAAEIDVKTKIGVPGRIGSIEYDAPWLKWEHEECNGPNCSYELHYTINGTTTSYSTPINHFAVSLRDLNITCPVNQGDIPVRLEAVSTDEEGHRLIGPPKERKISCPSEGLAFWIILIIAFICIITTLIIVFIFTYGRDQLKRFIDNLNRKPALPYGLDSQIPSQIEGKKKWYDKMPINRETITTNSSSFKPSEEQDLIKPGNERQPRNFSGDSGTSVADQADSSGCSTGGDSVSSSGSDRIPPSSDSGTVQEETAFPSEEKKLVGLVRLRNTAPPYVLPGLSDKMPTMKDYVSVGSVPNLAVSATDGISSLQQSNPTLGLQTVQEMPMGGRRTSTGYISMPTNESDGMSFPMDDLGTLVFPHERRPGDLLAYSRHYMPYKKTSDFSPYSKAQSLPWLNTGYVAVAQAEDGGQTVPGAQGYVAVGDALNLMKRQPSLSSLPMNISKTLTTPDQDLPPGAYCKLGARGSPDPPSNSLGYVSATQHMAQPHSPAMSTAAYKSPYVTCAMADSMVSPKKEPRKTTTDYVTVGDIADGQWAHPIIHPMTPEETREVLSAPVEGSRGRAIQPVRPNSSETNHNRGSSQFGPSGHSLSKQSSGYASGNVSQETLTFHDPVVMSPKKLLTRSHEPHSVVYSPHHKPSMV